MLSVPADVAAAIRGTVAGNQQVHASARRNSD